VKKLLAVLMLVLCSTNAFAASPGIGFVDSTDLQCDGDRCVFFNKSNETCATGSASLPVFDSPHGRFIGWLFTSTGYPEAEIPVIFKRWQERSRDGFTYLRGIEEPNSKSTVFYPRSKDNENSPVDKPLCG
jgi:hypothetical protein